MKQVILFFSCLFLMVIVISSCEDSPGINSPIETSNATEIVLNSIDHDGNINQITVDRSEIKPNRQVDTKRSGEDMASGHFRWESLNSAFKWTQSFNAKGTATSARGQIEVKYNFKDPEFAYSRDHHGIILCTYSDGNENVTAYYIDQAKSDDPGIYDEGTIFWFRTIDNGEGAKAETDQIYGTRWYEPDYLTFEEAQEYVNDLTCQDLFADYSWGSTNTISEGNIQVK